MIAFKYFRLLDEFLTLHPIAWGLAQWLERATERQLDQRFMVVTAVVYEGGSGVHADHRAFDVSARDYSTGKLLDETLCRKFETYVNEHWYHGSGGKYQVCLYHRSKGSDEPEWHFHLQVREATRQVR